VHFRAAFVKVLIGARAHHWFHWPYENHIFFVAPVFELHRVLNPRHALIDGPFLVHGKLFFAAQAVNWWNFTAKPTARMADLPSTAAIWRAQEPQLAKTTAGLATLGAEISNAWLKSTL
jgi:hypothetical protein